MRKFRILIMLRITFLFLVFCFLFSNTTLGQEYSLSQKDTSEVRFLNQRKFFIYKTEKGETLFSISKKFKIPQSEIYEFNPELKKDGLQPKMKLWIPAWSHLKKEEKKEISKEEHPENETYNVALMIALNISKSYSLDLSLVDSNFVGDIIDKETLGNLEFYEGTLKAIDSLKTMNFKVHMYVYDTEDDSMKTAELLKLHELKKMDVIVSNGNAVVTKLINAFSKNNHVRFSSSSLNAGELLSDNKDAIAVMPSSLTQCKEMGKIAAQKFKHDNCIVLRTALARENYRGAAFKRGWLDASEEKIKEVGCAIESRDIAQTIKDSLSTTHNNLIFVPSSNEDFVSSLVNGLKEYSEEYRIILIGLPTWQYFETIDPILLELLDVHLFTSSFININDPRTINFRKYFSGAYNVEPSEGAFHGFDVMMFLGSAMVKHGKTFNDHLPEQPFKGLCGSYRFERASENSFTENHAISVCKYQNYELKKIEE